MCYNAEKANKQYIPAKENARLKTRRAEKSIQKRSKRMLPEKLMGNSIQLCSDLSEILIQIQGASTNLVAA